MQIKLDNTINDLNIKEKEYTALESKKDQLEKIIYDKDILINQIKEEYTKDKDEIPLLHAICRPSRTRQQFL